MAGFLFIGADVLELKDLSKTYKKQIVFSGLNARFDKGVTILTGPSGVGKSTLLRLCASAEKPSSGSVHWNGAAISKSSAGFRQTLGYAPQIISFPEDLTAADFMLHIGAMKRIGSKAALGQSQTILDRLGLLPDIHKRIGSYSGGMRRRLGLAQAFLGAPKCLIIDEPTAELDPATAEKVHDLIFETSSDAVVVMTTHLENSLSRYNFEKLELTGV